MEVYINNQQDKVEFDKEILDTLERLTVFTLKKEGIDNYEVGLTLMDDAAIQALNRTYRGLDRPTDVLSFPLTDDDVVEGEPLSVMGDIVISAEAALRQAEEYGHTLLRETAYLLVHGLYHILGYSHDEPIEKEKMRLKEETILSNFKVTRD